MYAFVYGTLKQGGGLHYWMQGAHLVGPAETHDRTFLMIDLGYFPGVVKYEHGLKIKGELYEINENMLATLDRVEGYPRLYTREQVPVVCNGETYAAWIYLYNANPQRTYKFIAEWSN